MRWIHPLAALVVAISSAGGCRAVPVRPPSVLPYHDDISFRGFAEEALHGYGTPRTHRFDDFTPGSYHVDPREVAEGLFQIAPTYGLPLAAVAVVGPYGPIWAYDVITIVPEVGCTRVNWLVMPHARITIKRSGCVTIETVASFLADLNELATSTEPLKDERSCVVIGQGSKLRWSRFDCYATDASPASERMTGALQRLSSWLSVSYSGYPPGKSEHPEVLDNTPRRERFK